MFIVGVAEVGVGYAVVFEKCDVFIKGVVVGVDVGNGIEDEVALGMPKFCNEDDPVIGVGVECR